MPKPEKLMQNNTPKFFVEFSFDYELTGRRYWFPLFLAADNPNTANQITQTTKKALEEHYKNIQHTTPIPEAELTKPYIKHKFDMHKSYPIVLLNVDEWEFENTNPELSFNEHLEFIANNEPLYERDVARRIAAHRFPVRVIKQGEFPIDFKEFLLINVVA
jgi:hypothetical protein